MSQETGARFAPAMAKAAGRSRELSIGSVLECGFQFLQPGSGIAVARRAPVAAGAERAAGRDLGRIGDGAALELAELEEAEQEYLQPFADRGQVIFPLQRLGIVDRPE